MQLTIGDFIGTGVVLLFTSVLSFLFVFSIYFLYFTVIYRDRKHVQTYLHQIETLQQTEDYLPNVSIIVSTYNEAKVIQRKIHNLATLNYPQDKIELLVIDDCSTDGTSDLAEQAIQVHHLNGRVIQNPERIGLNPSLNVAFQQASHPLICVTDSDVTLEKDALKNALTVLDHFEDAGGVTGRIAPVHSLDSYAAQFESDYRHYYDRSMLTESAVHSAFPGNGPLIIFKTFPNYAIPANYGSSDANIVMNVIKKGQRMLYVPNAIIYEPVPETVGQQKLQKVRRATRLIQAFLHNANVFLNRAYGRFGTVIFPLKFLIHVFCPLLMFIGLLTFIPYIALYASFSLQFLAALLLVTAGGLVVVSRKLRSFCSSFLFHQIYLLLGFFSLPKQSRTWRTIERK